MSNGCRLAWYRWTLKDCYSPKFWTAFTIGVYAPSRDRPVVAVLFSIANGGGKVFMRFRSMAELQQYFILPNDKQAIDRLLQAEVEAGKLADQFEADMKLILDAKHRRQLIDADTGEIVAEAERIIKGE